MPEPSPQPMGSPHRPRRGPRAVVAALAAGVLLAVPALARGQLLNLDAPGPLPPGQGRAALAQAARMQTEAAGIGGVPDDKTVRSLQGRCRAQYRRLVRLLLLRGEELGEPGSIHVVVARTLAAGLVEWDALAGRIGNGPDASLLLAMRQFADDVAALGETEEAAQASIPADAAELDRLVRDLFALPVQMLVLFPPNARDAGDPPWHQILHAGGSGWVVGNQPLPDMPGAPPDLSTLATSWAAAGRIPEDTAAALRRFDETVLRPAQTLAVARPQARGLIDAAHDTAGELATLPTWVPEEARARLSRRFDAALLALTDRPTQAEGLRDLATLRRACAAIADLDVASRAPASFIAPNVRLTSISAMIPAEPGLPEVDGARFDAVARAADLLAQRAPLGDESGVIRELRPAWRTLDPFARKTETDLWGALSKVATAAAPASDPAFIGALAAHRRALDDLAALRTISRALADPALLGADQPGQSSPAAQSILKLAQSTGKPDTRDSSIATLRMLASDLNDLAVFPGEPQLRGAAAAAGGREREAWQSLTGDNAGALVAVIDATRRRWLTSWPGEGTAPGADAAALRNLRALVGALVDAAALRLVRTPTAGDGRGPLQYWPGWEVDARALASIDEQLVQPALQRATAAAISADAKGLKDAMAQVNGLAPLLQLVSQIATRLRRPPDFPLPPFVEAAAPPPAPPGGAWALPARADIAAVCRYLDEYAEMVERKDNKTAARLLNYINFRAEAAVRAISSK